MLEGLGVGVGRDVGNYVLEHNNKSNIDQTEGVKSCQEEIPKTLKVRANELAKQIILLEVLSDIHDHAATNCRQIFSFPTPKMVEHRVTKLWK
ncbi:hypothetical protein F444_10635 [Phytophthora nicotianae P1976]|uniref:Uncharacterized protein n=1 Tax=Phytophthora nicotianae P1976 TaxID=1317066 RepID=A0A081A3D0_PHYNI|nr:hypothetical protein F444_10635 [Phytophthora nicotianae P1976]